MTVGCGIGAPAVAFTLPRQPLVMARITTIAAGNLARIEVSFVGKGIFQVKYPKKHLNRKDAKNSKENQSVVLPQSFT
jgi:hypothetical protein